MPCLFLYITTRCLNKQDFPLCVGGCCKLHKYYFTPKKHSQLGQGWPLWVGSEFANFGKLQLRVTCWIPNVPAGIAEGLPCKLWVCMEFHWAKASTKLILGSWFLLYGQNVMESGDNHPCWKVPVVVDLPGLGVGGTWVISHGLFQARWLCLHQSFTSIEYNSLVKAVCLLLLRNESGNSLRGWGGLVLFIFLPETQRSGQCLWQSTGAQIPHRHSPWLGMAMRHKGC